MVWVVRATEVKGEGKGEDLKFDSWHFPLNNSLPFVNQEQLNKRLYNISLLAYACHSGQQVPKYANKTHKPQDNIMGEGEDTAISSNITIQESCWSLISESQVPTSLLIQPNTALDSSVHL